MALSPFHLVIPVHDLPAARKFYGETFGLSEGRSSEQWVDFDFYGHQLVIHEHPQTPSDRKSTRLNSSHMSESRMPSSA